MIIVIYKDSIEGLWHYAPKMALDSMPILRMDSDNGMDTQAKALELAKRDKSIPKSAKFEIES